MIKNVAHVTDYQGTSSDEVSCPFVLIDDRLDQETLSVLAGEPRLVPAPDVAVASITTVPRPIHDVTTSYVERSATLAECRARTGKRWRPSR